MMGWMGDGRCRRLFGRLKVPGLSVVNDEVAPKHSAGVLRTVRCETMNEVSSCRLINILLVPLPKEAHGRAGLRPARERPALGPVRPWGLAFRTTPHNCDPFPLSFSLRHYELTGSLLVRYE